jgi:hypothetical protein
MKKFYLIVSALVLIFLTSSQLQAQTIWDSNMITFTKEAYTDWTLPENQDRIKEDIWITRGNAMPIFNIAEEDYDLWGSSPSDTKWAFGSISDGVENLLFDSWGQTIRWNPPAAVEKEMVLFLVSDSIFIDIKFTSWTSGGGTGGGGFSYIRSTGESSDKLWTGDPIAFTKADYADWTLAGNQDRITDHVWITRADNQGLFNIVNEDGFYGGEFGTVTSGSPFNTEWAFGKIADGVETLAFDYWGAAINWSPPQMVGKDMVLHLISEDIYIDIKFTSWTSGQGSGGGGFSYERSTGTPSDRLWTGDALTFTKPNNADWTQAANQDRITDGVWLTRADSEGIFNIAHQDQYQGTFVDSPTKTMWAFGSTAQGIANLNFDFFLQTIEYYPPGMLNQDMVLYLVPYDTYIDITFTSWSSGSEGGGGGFSYTRASEPATAVASRMTPEDEISFYPNPASEYFYLRNADPAGSVSFDLYDPTGKMIESRILKGNGPFPVSHLQEGLYFYRIDKDGLKYQGTVLISR